SVLRLRRPDERVVRAAQPGPLHTGASHEGARNRIAMDAWPGEARRALPLPAHPRVVVEAPAPVVDLRAELDRALFPEGRRVLDRAHHLPVVRPAPSVDPGLRKPPLRVGEGLPGGFDIPARELLLRSVVLGLLPRRPDMLDGPPDRALGREPH